MKRCPLIVIPCVYKCFSQRPDIVCEVRFFHETVGPNYLHQLVFLDNPASPFDKSDERLKGFRSKRHTFRPARKQTLTFV